MMNEEPTPRKSDIIDPNHKRNSINTSNNGNQGGKTFDLRRSMDGTSIAGR